VASDSLILLRLRPPVSFPLCSDEGSPIPTWLRCRIYSKVAYVPIKRLAVYLILLKSHDVLVKLFLSFDIDHSVKSLTIREISSVELKVRRVID
jgi:hypothetical protein